MASKAGEQALARKPESDAGIDIEDDEDDGPTRPSSSEPSSSVARLDSYSFSMHNLQESQDTELDAILGELCALGSQFERELHGLRAATQDLGENKKDTKNLNDIRNVGSGRFEISSIGGGAPPTSDNSRPSSGRTDARTDSPDNDSAFSDSISMLSGESSASSGARTSSSADTSSGKGRSEGTLGINDDIATAACLHDISRNQAEQAAQIKAEKIKMALEKLKEASIRKLFIKVFCSDNSAKSLLVDESMSVSYVTRILADKSHVAMDPKWTLVETIPQLYMERVYEEHENLVENLLLWTRDSCNRILFEERPQKYDMFVRPEKYLADSGTQTQLEFDEDSRMGLIEEFFMSPGTSGVSVPEVEGQLFLKSEGKKHWKKHFFVLRASGLYYCPKGKSKLPKDLVCLTTFEMNCVYNGVGWKKKFKAPSEFCFAIKHPQIQSKSCKNIKYLCADDPGTLNKWITGIRIAKYGRQIKENYDALQRDIVEADLEKLAYHRSFSVSSMAKQLTVSPNGSNSSESPTDNTGQPIEPRKLRHSASTGSDSTLLGSDSTICEDSVKPSPTPVAVSTTSTLRRRDSIASSSGGSSSIGSMSSDRSSVASDPAVAFDLDFPGGTIKRKPNLQPRIPLTSTTRSLVKDSASSASVNATSLDDSASIISGSSLGSGGSLGRTAGLRFSLRRSHTDEQMTATLARLKQRHQQAVSATVSTPVKGPLTPTKTVQLLPMLPVEAMSLEDISEASQATPKASPSHAPIPPPKPCPPVAPLTAKNLEKLAQDLANQCRASVTDVTFNSPPPEKKPASVIYAEPNVNFAFGATDTNVQSCSDGASLLYHPSNLSSMSSCQLSDSTTSLDSLPPPPPMPLSDQSWPSVSSLCSLPPPPSNLVTPTNSPPASNQATPTARSPLSSSSQATPTNESFTLPGEMYSPSRQTPYWLTRAPPIVGGVPRLPSPSKAKPAPPKRSETTRLSSSNKHVQFAGMDFQQPAPMVSPPEEFLRDLHRVMDKKWKVAQTLQMTHMQDHTAHQILGFRDPRLLSEDEQHHEINQPSLRGILMQESQGGRAPMKQVRLDLPGLVCHSPKAKPPPPKRSDTTQLSCTQLKSPTSPMSQQRLGIY